MMTSTVLLSVDGACSNHGGLRARHGGWAAILSLWGEERVYTGYGYPETNSTAEIKALMLGLSKLESPCRVEFLSDSQYVVNSVNLWLTGWMAKSFRGVAHANLWRPIAQYKAGYGLSGTWIRGHAPKGERSAYQELNVRCDELAVEAAWQSYRELSGEKP